MNISIYLHKPIAETLMCYGSLSDVVNKILTHCESGEIDLMDKPNVPSREGASRYNVDVKSDYYEEILSTFPVNSPRISLRRLLYWFVENEMYDVLEWEPVKEYINTEKVKLLKKVDAIISDTCKLKLSVNEQELVWLNVVLRNLNELKETINER